jgi:hypothetical protein
MGGNRSGERKVKKEKSTARAERGKVKAAAKKAAGK